MLCIALDNIILLASVQPELIDNRILFSLASFRSVLGHVSSAALRFIACDLHVLLVLLKKSPNNYIPPLTAYRETSGLQCKVAWHQQ